MEEALEAATVAPGEVRNITPPGWYAQRTGSRREVLGPFPTKGSATRAARLEWPIATAWGVYEVEP